MLKNQMEKIEKLAGEQGLLSQNQRRTKLMEEKRRKETEFDQWLSSQK